MLVFEQLVFQFLLLCQTVTANRHFVATLTLANDIPRSRFVIGNNLESAEFSTD